MLHKRISTFIAFCALALGALPIFAQAEPVTITWFVGLGTGTNEQQIEAQNQVVADFNAAHPEINLVVNIGANFETSRDTFSTLVAAGTPPDIVGPVGVGGSNAFSDQWADLQPLVDASGYDLTAYDSALVDLYRTSDGQLLGIPFAVFPSMTYYNADLFDEAGLAYPPATFDTPYVMPDGSEVPWNYETVAEIAKMLTVDENGNDATSADFDPSKTVQFGMNFQWAQYRLMLTQLQPEALYDGTSITIPDSWKTGSKWIQDAIWTSHFMPSTAYDGSELLNSGNAFSSGNIAMAIAPLWYTCCMDATVNTNVGVVPQGLDGEYHVATDADTFRLTKGSQHPEEAFVVLSYLLNEAVPTLTGVYGAFPARPEYQQTFIDGKLEQFASATDLATVPAASLAYNNPNEKHHEANFPNWQKGADRLQAFSTLLFGETGADVDVDAELAAVEADLNSIIKE